MQKEELTKLNELPFLEEINRESFTKIMMVRGVT